MPLPAIPDYAATALKNAVQLLGKPVLFFEGTSTTGRSVRARVVYLSAAELANAIEQYPIRVTLDARDFVSRIPQKGDALMIDGARRAILQVVESHLGDHLIQYTCGVAG